MSHTIIKQPAKMIMGIACRTRNTPDAAPRDIPKLWERFFQEDILSKIPNRISQEIFALYCEYEGDYTKPYTVVVGSQVSSLNAVPEGMVGREVPGGTFALFQAIGEHPKTLIATWQQIWQDKGLKRTYTRDYEIYGEGFTKSPQEVDVCIGVDIIE